MLVYLINFKLFLFFFSIFCKFICLKILFILLISFYIIVSCVNYNIFRSKLIFLVRFVFFLFVFAFAFIYAQMLGTFVGMERVKRRCRMQRCRRCKWK